jgi:hypothetical protein
MKQTTKPTSKEVAAYLKEALQPFCEQTKDLRPALAEPFCQADHDGEDCVMVSDGHILICIRAKKAGCAVTPFRKMDDFDAHKPIPFIDSNHLLQVRTVRRIDMELLLEQMEKHEQEHKQIAVADMLGVLLNIEGLSHIERAMAIFGAELARLVWHEDMKVVLQLDNERRQEAVTILHMGCDPKDSHAFVLPTAKGDDGADVELSWQRGMEAWAGIKAEQERREEAERMARREVYMVEVVKRAYIPVYAKDADEACRLCDEEFIDPEDDGDDMWMLGDTVPEVEDLDDLDDCYEHVVTRDGLVERDEIYDLERISDEWHAEHDNKDKEDCVLT